MTSREKKRLDDLERRVKELEARPVTHPVIVIQPSPPPPVYQPLYVGPWTFPQTAPTYTPYVPGLIPGIAWTC